MIVRADGEYIPQIAEIEKAAFTDPWSEKSLESALSEETNIFLAEISEGKVRGYIIGSCDGYSGYIERIAVNAAHRKMGIGTQLLSAFENALPETADSISLEVRASNSPAIGLYGSFGFERAGVRRGMYSSPKEDGIVMIKKVIK
ncbi:MAG: ribosomal protein S18-alanine N-acetyltransferase [Huintestinicola sp.]|uniref:ribosomal protein S18-alanine N-acetyltransferase n=1 Tax=Huintestinicola sp. TaxID=2981661 RepID=UPI003F10BA6E